MKWILPPSAPPQRGARVRESHTPLRKAIPQGRSFSTSGSGPRRQGASSSDPVFDPPPQQRHKMTSDRSLRRFCLIYPSCPFYPPWSVSLPISISISPTYLHKIYALTGKIKFKKSLCGRAGSASNTWIRPLSGPRSLNAGNINPQTGKLSNR